MRGQRGEGKLGLFIWLIIFAAGVFVAVRTIPVKIAVYEFNDFCEKETRIAATRQAQPDHGRLLNSILEKAEELQIPLDKKQIKIKATQAKVFTDVKYQVSVDLEFYTWVWEYDQHYESIRM